MRPVSQTMTARAPARWPYVVLVLALAAAAVLGADLAWRAGRWHAVLQGVRFVDHREKISASDAALTVSGYLVATVESDVDFFRLAEDQTAYPNVEAELCSSGKPVGVWRDPLPAARTASDASYRYSVLIAMRGKGVDLSKTSEDVCLRFRAAGTNPLTWVRSRPLVVPLRGELHAQLASYASRDASVELVLDPGCAPQLCEPQFSRAGLEH